MANVNRMMKRIILLGEEGKRKDYFLKAGEKQGIDIEFYPLFSNTIFEMEDKENLVLKIDPPIYTSFKYNEFHREIKKYIGYLNKLDEYNFNFLNSPKALVDTLDKHKAKDILADKNISITQKIKLKDYSLEELLSTMENQRIMRVFIKPRYGSGALGVMALQYNFEMNDYVLYTSLYKKEDEYINSKIVKRIRDRDRIFDLLDEILKDKPIVEKWLQKDKVDGNNYDIRVLVQFGQVRFMVARASEGPITNLHLNNKGIDIDKLNLSKDNLNSISKLALSAVEEFEGLNLAGVDILLDRKRKAYVIEINGQGDLLYKDIYDKNSIYTSQVERMIKYE